MALGLKDIFDAVASSDIKSIKEILVSKPHLLNKAGPGGQTPLMNAVLSGKTDSVKLLLSLGSDMFVPEKDGYTPMVYLSACSY